MNDLTSEQVNDIINKQINDIVNKELNDLVNKQINDIISRQEIKQKKVYSHERHEYVVPVAEIDWLPSAQPEIIRCKDCKHWKPQVKGVNGGGLGGCNFHKANFVTGEGFCYWAERREEDEAD